MQGLLPPVIPRQTSAAAPEERTEIEREHHEEARARRRRRKEADADEDGDRRERDTALPPNRRRKGNALSRDQWASVVLLFLVVIGGSKLSFWLFVQAHDAFCIAFNLSCKPKGY
jgi:hypothetical protein